MKNLTTTLIMFGACLFMSSQALAAAVVDRVSSPAAKEYVQEAKLADMRQNQIPVYGELLMDIYVDDSEETCVKELKKAEILVEEMEFLGTKQKVFNGYKLIAVTAVVETAGEDEYYVMSCRINNDKSGHVAGPTNILKRQSYFTRSQPQQWQSVASR